MSPLVRRVAARALGDLLKQDSVGPLISLLEREEDNEVRRETLIALENLCLDQQWWTDNVGTSTVRTDRLSNDQREQFTQTLLRLSRQDLPDSTAARTLEWLEAIAAEKSKAAHRLILEANMDQAEKLLVEAHALSGFSI